MDLFPVKESPIINITLTNTANYHFLMLLIAILGLVEHDNKLSDKKNILGISVIVLKHYH